MIRLHNEFIRRWKLASVDTLIGASCCGDCHYVSLTDVNHPKSCTSPISVLLMASLGLLASGDVESEAGIYLGLTLGSRTAISTRKDDMLSFGSSVARWWQTRHHLRSITWKEIEYRVVHLHGAVSG